MTLDGPQIAGATATRDAARGALDDWAAIRASDSIQYAPLPPPQPPQTPPWLEWFYRMLESVFGPIGKALGAAAEPVKWILIALGFTLLLLALWRLVLAPLLERWRMSEPETEDWTPGARDAAALLEEADRLAAEGRYGEAAHLLLQRSVEHIAEARPEWLLPASTAREISAFPMLSERARGAFAIIAGRVERSAFAQRELDARDWQAARGAYSQFALDGLEA
ncbi:hypothetical protein [Novosphingobium aquimarinum]|uniref:hypothetical protein n=1 Tax=Novosphingobium aquimarinum TaxID=2682494 RepID=UPI001E457806|nr:hypothetical protein [Novosphingobium aquimarinum]